MINSNNPAISRLTSIWSRDSTLTSTLQLQREKRPPIENLVFEGGGVKGLVYAGALEALHAQGLLEGIKRVAGSSAGGITAMLVALGYSAAEIQSIMNEEINFAELMDRRVDFDPTRVISAQGMKLGLTDIYMLFKHKGLYRGDAFVELSKGLIRRKLQEGLREALRAQLSDKLDGLPASMHNSMLDDSFKTLLDSLYIKDLGDITFIQLKTLNDRFPGLHLKELYVSGTKLSDGSFKEFSADTTPNTKVVDAVRITMSFPFGFEPVLYQGDYYADGGIADNYPMQIFDQEKFLTHGRNQAGVNPATLGFLVDTEDEINARWGILPGEPMPLSLSRLIQGVIEGIHNRAEILRNLYQVNSVQIFDEEVETMDLALSPEKKQRLIESGRKAMRAYNELYLGKDVAYNNLPDYKTVYERYYSKRPPEIIRIIEEELWPLYQELLTLMASIHDAEHQDEYSVKEGQALAIISKLEMVVKIRDSLQVLDEHMDVAMDALAAYKSQYMDPRASSQSEHRLYFQTEERLRSLRAYYKNHSRMDEAQKNSRIQEHNALIEDLIQFGLSENEASTWAEYYFLMVNHMMDQAHEREPLIEGHYIHISNDAREKIMLMLLYRQLETLHLADNDSDLESIENIWHDIKNDYMLNGYELGLAELLAKKEVIKQLTIQKTNGKYRLNASHNNEGSTEINYLYSVSLREATKRLATGRWGDQITLSNRDNILANSLHMQTRVGETYGKQASEYRVVTLEHKIHKTKKYLAFQRKYKLPSIKSHILIPQNITIENPYVKVKEIIVAFQQPALKAKEERFGLISKYSAGRKKYFDEHKAELITQVKWAISQAKKQNIQPIDAKFRITISGEGLAGQDAQYMLSALIEELKEQGEQDDLKDIENIDLILTDPSRVSHPLAKETADSIHALKVLKPELTVTGYNLIHKRGAVWHSVKRKAQNLIGSANVLSYVSPEEASVTADFRNYRQPLHQYEQISNQTHAVKLRQELNKKTRWQNTTVARHLNVKSKKMLALTKSIALGYFPKFTLFMLKLPYNVGAFALKRLLGPVANLTALFKDNQPLPIIPTDWVNQLDQIIPASEPVSALDWRSVANKLIEQGSLSERLKAPQRPPIENLVLEGGGIKGLVYPGALEEMEKAGMLENVKRVAGSSAGGITAMLVALNFNSSEMVDVIDKRLDFKKLMDAPYSLGGFDTLFSVKGMDIGITSFVSLFKNKGLYKGDNFKFAIKELVREKMQANIQQMLFKSLTAAEIAQLKADAMPNEAIGQHLNLKLNRLLNSYGIDDLGDVTLFQLKRLATDFPQLNLKELYLTGTNLSNASLKVFSAESEPDMPLVDAVRITMSFPGAFMPVLYKGHYYADGGIADNYPTQIFDNEEFLSYGINDAGGNPATLGLLVDSKQQIESRWGVLTGDSAHLTLPNMIKSVFKGMHNRSEILNNKYNINSIQIIDNVSSDGVYEPAETMDLAMPEAKKQRLIQNGRDEIKRYVENYRGPDVSYTHYDDFNSLEQKHFQKSVTELRRILETEVMPLLADFETVKIQLIAKHSELLVKIDQDESLLDEYLIVNQAIENAKFLEQERRVILRALQLKGAEYAGLPSSVKRAPSIPFIEPVQLSAAKITNSSLLARKDPASEIPLKRKVLDSIFKPLFPSQKWEFYSSSEKLAFKHRESSQKQITIEVLGEDMKFSGMPVSKIVKAASLYEDNSDDIIDFEVNAESLEQAKSYIRSLLNAGFDINKITAIHCANQTEKVDVQQLISTVQHPPSNRIGFSFRGT